MNLNELRGQPFSKVDQLLKDHGYNQEELISPPNFTYAGEDRNCKIMLYQNKEQKVAFWCIFIMDVKIMHQGSRNPVFLGCVKL